MVLDVWGIVQAYFSLISEDAIASMRVLRINGKEGIKKSVQSLRSPFRSPNPPQKSTFEVSPLTKERVFTSNTNSRCNYSVYY